MTKDPWYKRLGWFLFFSLIALTIFYVIDVAVNGFVKKYTEKTFVAAYVEKEYTFKKGETIVLEFDTDATDFTIDVFIDGVDTELDFKNEKTLVLELKEPLEIGTYKVQSSVIGKKGIAREREIVIETTLIITE